MQLSIPKVELINLEDITGLPPSDELKAKSLPEIGKILGEMKYEEPPVSFSPQAKNTATALAYLIIKEIVKEIKHGESGIYFYYEPGGLKAIFRHMGHLQDINLTCKMLGKTGLVPDFSKISIKDSGLLDRILQFFLNCPELNSYKNVFTPSNSIAELKSFYQFRQVSFPQSQVLKDNNTHLLEIFVLSLYTTSFYQILNSFLRSHGCTAKPLGAEDDIKASSDLSKQDSAAVNLQVKILIIYNCLLHQAIRKLNKTALPTTPDQKKLLTVRSETIAKDAGFFRERVNKIQKKRVVAEESPLSTATAGIEFVPEVLGNPNVFTMILQDAGETHTTYSTDVQALSEYPDEAEQLLPPLQELNYLKIIKDEAKEATFLVAKPVISIENCSRDYQKLPVLKRRIRSCLEKLILLALLEPGNQWDDVVRLFTGIPQKFALIKEMRIFSEEYSTWREETLSLHLEQLERHCKAINSKNHDSYCQHLDELGKLCSQFILKRPAVDCLEILCP
jgi:hypothetical protein